MRTLSAAARQAIYAQETGQAFIWLLTIVHPNMTDPIRLSSDPTQTLPVANTYGTVSRGQEYVFLPFTLTLPNEDDTGVCRAQISIDNVDRRMVQAVRTADRALEITLEMVLSSTPDTVEIEYSDFRLEQVSYNALTISGDLTLEYYELEPFPKLRFTPNSFPGMF